MTKELLTAQVDHEIYAKLNEYLDLIGVSRDAVVNEALKHYLCGRVPARSQHEQPERSLDANVQVSLK